MKEVYDHALDLKIVGIVCAKEGTTSMNLSPGVAYTKELTQYIIEKAQQSEIVKKQMANRDVNVFSGKRFDDESEESGLQFEDMITVDTEMLSSAFGVTISEDDISKMTQGYMTQISNAITTDTSAAQNAFTSTLTTMASDMLSGYIDENYNEMIHCAVMKKSQVDSVVNAYMQSDNCKTLLAKLEADYLVPQDTFVSIYSEILNGMLQGYIGMASTNPEDADPSAFLTTELVAGMVPQLTEMDEIKAASEQISDAMTEAVMQKMILTKVGELSGELMGSMANAFHVDESAIAGAFQFNLSEEELSRLMETMTASGVEKNADTNLTSLGYQDVDEPTAISFYFSDFDSKEAFVDFIDEYNKKMETFDEEKVITYTDITGILISSVSTIVNSVTYVLIAFVSISLIVSSIMIGIITYISVLERTKEIGVLRAIGASKKNISSIFNAETFIVGLCSGLLGIGVTLALVPPINYVIHRVTNNYNINAVLPVEGAVILVVLSVILTLISGLIPSKQAAKKDPVLALRSE